MFNKDEIRESNQIADIDRDLFRGMKPRNYTRSPSKLARFFKEWVLPVAGGALFGAGVALLFFFSL